MRLRPPPRTAGQQTRVWPAVRGGDVETNRRQRLRASPASSEAQARRRLLGAIPGPLTQHSTVKRGCRRIGEVS